MSAFRSWALPGLLLAAALLGGCASPQRAPADPWPALRAANPASVVVLPPLNASPDVEAPASVMAHATVPLAEAGYYVLPVALVAETLRLNGVQTAMDAQQISPRRLKEVFGADTALYLSIRQYGSVYRVISSDAVVTLEARLVELPSGETLWTGTATASSAEQRGSQAGGLVGALLQAVIEQVASNFNERNHQVAGLAMQRLLSPGPTRALLPGPRSPLRQAPARP
jgi:hypothetical protein